MGKEKRDDTPRALGYRWPAEWEPHAAAWLAWPRNRDTWPGRYEHVPAQFAEFVRVLAEYEPVQILAGGQEVLAEAARLLSLSLPPGEGRGEGIEVPGKPAGAAPREVDPHPNPLPQGEGSRFPITLHNIPTNDAWCRDHGPTFLSGPPGAPPALIDWQYNAWGGKYPPFDLDNAVPQQIARLQNRRVFSPGIVLEGGAIENNGRGVLLTTERCLVNPNRNPQLSRAEMETYLRDYLAVEKILWLTRGDIPGDDTDGHIDQLARFVNPTTIVAAVATDETDECFAELQAMWNDLVTLTDLEDRHFTVVPLPIPQPKFVGEQRLPASYCNFLIANGIVIVPQFDDPTDAVAVETLQRLFPDRVVRGCGSLELVWGLGSFHCLSQQEPRL